MTLNGVIALILRFFSLISISLLAKYVAVVEYNRPILSVEMSPTSSLQLLVLTNPLCSTVSIPDCTIQYYVRVAKQQRQQPLDLMMMMMMQSISHHIIYSLVRLNLRTTITTSVKSVQLTIRPDYRAARLHSLYRVNSYLLTDWVVS